MTTPEKIAFIVGATIVAGTAVYVVVRETPVETVSPTGLVLSITPTNLSRVVISWQQDTNSLDQLQTLSPAASWTLANATSSPAILSAIQPSQFFRLFRNPPPITRKVIVMLVNFSDDTSEPWTTNEIAHALFTASNSVSTFYLENSYGKLAFAGDVVGWFTIPFTATNCARNYLNWMEAANEAATQSGVSLADYEHRIFILNRTSTCPFTGNGSTGPWVWTGGQASGWVIGAGAGGNSWLFAHELGHNLGLKHARSIDCRTAQIAPYSSCTISELGDRTDVMGWVPSRAHFNAPHKIALNWITTSQVQTVTTNGMYAITPLENHDLKLKALKILKPDTIESYYISYRQPIGFDSLLNSNLTAGASIHIWDGLSPAQTKMIDTTPGDTNMFNAALSDNTAFSDNVNGIQITQISHNQASCVLNVSFAPGTESK